jgi:hypothetical protein
VVLDTNVGVGVEFRRIPYAIDLEAAAIRESSLPDRFAADIETGGNPSPMPVTS